MDINQNYQISREELARMNHLGLYDVKCQNCRFSGLVNYDHRTCRCDYFKCTVQQSSFCSHFTRKIDIKELLKRAAKGE